MVIVGYISSSFKGLLELPCIRIMAALQPIIGNEQSSVSTNKHPNALSFFALHPVMTQSHYIMLLCVSSCNVVMSLLLQTSILLIREAVLQNVFRPCRCRSRCRRSCR